MEQDGASRNAASRQDVARLGSVVVHARRDRFPTVVATLTTVHAPDALAFGVSSTRPSYHCPFIHSAVGSRPSDWKTWASKQLQELLKITAGHIPIMPS